MKVHFTFIPLTQGQFTVIDEVNFKWLNQYKWWFQKGYAFRIQWNKITKKYDRIYMHRLVNKTPKGFFTDHINRNKLDNRQSNLRTVTSSQNKMNMDIKRNNTSGVRGVWFDKTRNKWAVEIMINQKKTYLGRFEDKQEAIKIRKQAEKEYFKEFAPI